MITPTERILTVVNFFSGVGGCALGMKWAGFVSLGSFDLDAKALRGLAGLTGGPLLVARQPEVARDYLRRPPKQRVRNVGEVLGLLPSPASDHGDEMHHLPGTAAMTALRLACADPNKAVSATSKGDWRDIPERVRCMWGPVPERVQARPAASKGKQDGKHGVEAWDLPAHTVTGRGARPPSGRCSVADPRVVRHPTHYLVIEDGEHVLYGPELDLVSNRPAAIVILAPDGTWHRPMTDRELACLQGFPIDCQLEGPSSTRPASKPSAKHPNRPIRPSVPGRREHIGNAIPPPTAHAIGTMIAECLRSSRVATFLRPGDVWVERADAIALEEAAA